MVVTVLAGLAFLNALAASVAGLATLLGWRAVYVPGGLGPSRVAPAALLGPLSPAAGWVLCGLGIAFAAAGYGLLRLSPLIRTVLLVLFACLAVVSAAATAWGVIQNEPGVLIGGLLKLAVILSLVWYLNGRVMRELFARRTPST